MKIVISLFIIFLCISKQSFSQENYSTAKDLQIHLQENNELFYKILDQEITDVDELLENKNIYIPPVLFALAEELFSKGKKEKAVFIYYLALIRSLVDIKQKEIFVNRNQKIIELYTQHFGRSINFYVESNFEKAENQILKACEYVKNHPADYSFKWIYLDGAETEKDISYIENISFDSKKQEKITFEVLSKIKKNLEKLKSY